MVAETDLLIVGGESDPNTRRIVDQAHLRSVDYVFWDTDSERARQIAWDFETCEIDLGDNRYRPTSLFLRYNVFEGEPAVNLAAFETVQAFALAWPDIRLLNRQTITDANNKSANLRHAKQLGFTIPSSLVMADLTPLSNMPDPTGKIIKPLGGGAHTLGVGDVFGDVQALAEMPPMFVQERLDGENLRVFSIGGELFCFHLKTSELDYRDDARVEVIHTEVPRELMEPTDRLVERLQFDYCALDFRCRAGFDEPVFLEINSFPMFVRFDDASANALADSVLKFLVGKTFRD